MKNIVTVGGGTGSYTVLSGLKNLKDVSLTALVSMADDGGSTGVLRSELGVLPPGDVRQCLVALSRHSEVMLKFMNYRFDQGKYSGDTVGNILLAGLEKVTGDFTEGVKIASKILNIRGKVVPITKNKAELGVLFSNEEKVIGESKIDQKIFPTEVKKIFYTSEIEINPDAHNAILSADYIIIGPGNFFCSIVPNLIVNGFKESISKSKAKIILPVNLTNKQGHTNNWKASDYVDNVEKYLGKKVDFILINNEQPSEKQVKYYESEISGEILVRDNLKEDLRIVRKALLSHTLVETNETDTVERSFIRHDSQKLAEAIEKII